MPDTRGVQDSSRLRGLVSVGTTACMFGLGVVLAKLITAVLNSFLISFLALAGGGALVAVYMVFRRQSMIPRLSRSAWGQMLLLALAGTALPLLLVVEGFARTSAIIAGVLLQAQGPAAVLLAALLLRERLTWRQLGGSALLLCGSVLVVWQGGQALTWQGAGAGVLFVLAGAVGYGFSLIPAKRLAAQADPLQLSALRLLLGACFVLPLLFFQAPLVHGTFTPSLVWIMALYIITNFCIGYIMQQGGLRYLKAWEAAAIMQTVPLFTALFAVIVLHEAITWLQLLGGTLVIIGGVIVARGEGVTIAGSKGLVEDDCASYEETHH